MLCSAQCVLVVLPQLFKKVIVRLLVGLVRGRLWERPVTDPTSHLCSVTLKEIFI